MSLNKNGPGIVEFWNRFVSGSLVWLKYVHSNWNLIAREIYRWRQLLIGLALSNTLIPRNLHIVRCD